MAAVALPTAAAKTQLFNPFHMASHQRSSSKAKVSLNVASSSRSPEVSTSSQISSATQEAPEAVPRTFKRLRSSLEQSLKTATRSKGKAPQPNDDFATITAASSGKGKERERISNGDLAEKGPDKEKSRSNMLKRFESKVGLRRVGKEAETPVPVPSVTDRVHVHAAHGSNMDETDKVRQAGFTSFMTPSLRQASMSSPALHHSSQALPSPKSQPAVVVSSSSSHAGLVSPTRDRTRRASMQPTTKEISGPTLLTPRRTGNGSAANGTASPRAGKSRPAPIFAPPPPSGGRSSTDTPRTSYDLPSPPDTPTPTRGQLGNISRRPGAASATHLPHSSPPGSPTRAVSPAHARSPSRRVITPTSRGLASASASHLPLGSPITASPPSSRRPSVDAPRKQSASPAPRASSPHTTTRPRAISPSSRSPAYTHNRHFNVSTTSLGSPSTPEQRELIRAATSLLCKELRKPPMHLSRSDGQKEWAEVEVRLQPLVRLERIWGKSGALAGTSSGQVNAVGGMNSGFSATGEERERRLFCEALRDGVVLCQLMNKYRPGTIARIDHREDGFKRTSNVTKFLAASSTQGVLSDDLFYRDDLIESTPDTLCRVARTIIALLKTFEKPLVDRTKVISGQGKKTTNPGPYSSPGPISRAASSTPNLLPQRSISPSTSPPQRKRWSPPAPGLATVRSDSPGSGTSGGTARDGNLNDGRTTPVNVNADREASDPPPSPPPKSPLRPRSQSELSTSESGASLLSGLRPLDTSSQQQSLSDSSSPSTGDYGADYPARQSRTSSNLTDSTAFSSLLDWRRNSSGQNKFATIRTVTTEATSFGSEIPSFTRTEASSVAASLADEMNRRRGAVERRPSEPAGVDLVSLAEEEEISASGSSSREAQRERSKAKEEQHDRELRIRLGKGKWPEDFLDAFQTPSSSSRPIPIRPPSDRGDSPLNSSPLSASPSRKLSIIGATRRNDSGDSVPSGARKATHRARHSVDTPTLRPKESILRREASPDLQNSRVILRRQSTQGGARRNGVYVPRSSMDEPRDGSDSPVPFPRTVSGEHAARATPSPDSPSTPNGAENDGPRVRGRFQSEVENTRARRQSRPNSYDELGRPRRSRFESMVNLGVASSNASASDLLSRDSMDGSAVRQTLIVKEEGKPPTHFQLGNCIGRGQFGTVYRALNLNTGQMVAVKRIRLEGLKEDEVTQLMREVDLMKRLSHPSIVKYEGMARDDDTLSIVLEYAESGSLGQTLKAFGKLNERLVASYVVKILEGLHYLHRCDVVHCDLKAANILTTKTGNVKLSDFGVSLNLRAMEREIKDVAGTPNWMAPEVIELKGASTKSDIWSLGCTVIELLTGRPPYGEIANSMTVMFRIVEDDMPPIPEGCSEPLQDFLQQCFNKDAEMRPNAEMLCEHPWLKKNWDALKELRPQDSIPFLRRVSTDLQKADVARYLAQIDGPIFETPAPESPTRAASPGSPVIRRLSNGMHSPLSAPDDPSFSPREHSFVKTTFSKPMICRVCYESAKKSAVICDQCSLIAHAKCARDAPQTCDLRSQLLLYAQYAEQGHPGNAIANPLEALSGIQTHIQPSSINPPEVSFVTPSPRPSIEITSSSPVPGQNAPTAFKFIAAFKRSRSSLSVDPGQPPLSASPSPIPPPLHEEQTAKRKASKLRRNISSKERPHSFSSNSTTPNASSMRTADSQSSKQDLVRKSIMSVTEPDIDPPPLPQTSGEVPKRPPTKSNLPPLPIANDEHRKPNTHVPYTIFAEPERPQKRDKDKSSGCTVQ
ncbi:hypothetical protein BJ138DRAFT_1152815 [Hygrophoropsis aurantiaca]|uniref:Uncharacterized protein n=1 Tax=Hygrophoropsis aurantiaca TaxID=72124 RepID=A0ACB8ACF5_9AGAM|nr:hypothetical protein BJ138DRAFT_1152815 [Hygrophoropsis aurantiaca]